jgi:flagellar secretion chaperone FliS
MTYASEFATGVTPVGLVIRLYENIVADLGRAVLAVRDGDVEGRTAQLQHALLLIAHLQTALDMNNGGEPARQLEKFYSLARGKILEAQIKQSGKILEELIQHFLSLREAWEQVEKQQLDVPVTVNAPQEAHVSCSA